MKIFSHLFLFGLFFFLICYKLVSQTSTKPDTIPLSLVKIPGGTFLMGDQFNEGYSNEQPVHSVTVSTFYMSRNEITFDEYDAYCAAKGARKPSDYGMGRGQRPVVDVDWYDAVEYCNWRSREEHLQEVYRINKNTKDQYNQNDNDTKKYTVTADWTANGYRLPTEAEWEYAAREGGRKVRFGNGRDITDPSQINFDASEAYKKEYSIVGEYRQKTLPVGSFGANQLGLHDMSGNVWEWCWDWYGDSYYAQSGGATNPTGAPSGKYRCIRGGSWYYDPYFCRAAYRNGWDPNSRSHIVGFRVVRH